MDVELRHLRAFVAVAEELSFTRAAARLHMAQQALSRQVRDLEERLGVVLLTRTSRKVELTEAGATLLEHARGVLEAAERAVAATRMAAGEQRTLTVGFVVAADHQALRPALEAFARQRPDVEVRAHFGDVVDPSAGLRSGHADVGVVVGAFDRSGLETRVLWWDRRGVLLAADHPLAERDELTIEELVDQPTFDFVTPDQIFRDYWMVTNHRDGRPPKIAATFRVLEGLITAVRGGLGVNVVREAVLAGAGPETGVVFRPVAELEGADVSIAWRQGDTRPEVEDLVAAAAEVFGT